MTHGNHPTHTPAPDPNCNGEGENGAPFMPDEIARTPARIDRGSGRDGRPKYWKGNKGLPSGRRRKVIKQLRARDGDECCFGVGCIFQRPLDFDTPTNALPEDQKISIEHRHAWYRYRSHDLEHLALAHSGCNNRHGLALWKQRAREGRLYLLVGQIDAWPALTYADELE